MKKGNEAKVVASNSSKRCSAAEQTKENPDRIKNHKDCRTRYRALLEKQIINTEKKIWENVILRTSHYGFEPVFNTTLNSKLHEKRKKKYKQTLINLSLLTLHVNVDYRHLDNLLILSHVL